MGEERKAGSDARGGVIAVGLAAVAVVCCAAWPVLIAVLGGIGVAAALGLAAGALASIGGVAAVVLAARKKRGRGWPARID